MPCPVFGSKTKVPRAFCAVWVPASSIFFVSRELSMATASCSFARASRSLASWSAVRFLSREREARAKEHDAVAMLNSRDTKKMELAGTQTAQNARGTFVFDPKTGHGML